MRHTRGNAVSTSYNGLVKASGLLWTAVGVVLAPWLAPVRRAATAITASARDADDLARARDLDRAGHREDAEELRRTVMSRQ